MCHRKFSFKHNASKLRESSTKQAQEDRTNSPSNKSKCFSAFLIEKASAVSSSSLKLGNGDEDLLAAQGLQLKSGGGEKVLTQRPLHLGSVGGPMHSGSRCFLLLGREARQGKLAPHLQRGSWHSQSAVPQRWLCPATIPYRLCPAPQVYTVHIPLTGSGQLGFISF